MPVKVWKREDGKLTNSVETSLGDSYRGERYRSAADALDREVDRMLDRAVTLSASEISRATDPVFVRRWALGRALAESGLRQSMHLELPGEESSLWLAIARKCRLGVRSNGEMETSWGRLIPNRKSDPQRTDRDVFAVGLWLQEQDLPRASMAFGGKFGNAQKFYARKALRPPEVREALAGWMEHQDSTLRSDLSNIRWFARVMKALANRFPARGPGSAKRPVHYSDEELYEEIRKVLDPLAAELTSAEAEPVLSNP